MNDSTPTPAGLVLTVSPEAVRSVEWAEVWEDHYDPALDAATNLKWLEKNAPDPIRNAIAGLRRGGRSDEAILDELRPRSASGERSISSEWSIGYADGQIRVAARPRTTP